MKQERTPQEEAKRAATLSAVMMIAMLFLAAVLGRSAVVQLATGRVVGGCISVVGCLLFLLVGIIMFNDFRKRFAVRKAKQEETHE